MTRPGLDRMAELAGEVGAAYRKDQEAERDSKIAEAELLADVLAVVAEAIPAIADRVVLRSRSSSAGELIDDVARWRGVHVGRERPLGDTAEIGAIAAPGPRRDGLGERGEYVGADLFLGTDDGLPQLWQVSYCGVWSSVEGEISRWRGAASPVDVVTAAGKYGVTDVIYALSVALEKAATERRDGRGGRLRERATRLRALSTLVRASL